MNDSLFKTLSTINTGQKNANLTTILQVSIYNDWKV